MTREEVIALIEQAMISMGRAFSNRYVITGD